MNPERLLPFSHILPAVPGTHSQGVPKTPFLPGVPGVFCAASTPGRASSQLGEAASWCCPGAALVLPWHPALPWCHPGTLHCPGPALASCTTLHPPWCCPGTLHCPGAALAPSTHCTTLVLPWDLALPWCCPGTRSSAGVSSLKPGSSTRAVLWIPCPVDAAEEIVPMMYSTAEPCSAAPQLSLQPQGAPRDARLPEGAAGRAQRIWALPQLQASSPAGEKEGWLSLSPVPRAFQEEGDVCQPCLGEEPGFLQEEQLAAG